MLPDAQYVAEWTFVVRYVDMTSRQERIVGMSNISMSSNAAGLLSYTVVIGGLEAYRKYTVEVYTVTQHGIESCGQAAVTVKTGKQVAADILTWLREKSTGVANDISYASVQFKCPSKQYQEVSVLDLCDSF